MEDNTKQDDGRTPEKDSNSQCAYDQIQLMQMADDGCPHFPAETS